MVNLASKEYSKAVEPLSEPDVVFLNVVFGCMETDKTGIPKLRSSYGGQDGLRRNGPLSGGAPDSDAGANPGIRPFGLPVPRRALRCEESDIY